jgi:GABA(A) receptor-associated protein
MRVAAGAVQQHTAGTFQSTHSFKDRCEESRRILGQFVDRVPVIVERSSACRDIAPIDKCKFLVPSDLTMGQLMYVIRKRIRLDASVALFLMVEGRSLAPVGSMVGEIYERHKGEDGFLYITYSAENAFG